MLKTPCFFRHLYRSAAALLPGTAALALSLALSAQAVEAISAASRPSEPVSVVKTEGASDLMAAESESADSDSGAEVKIPPVQHTVQPTALKQAAQKDSGATGVTAIDSFDVNAGLYLGGGIGLSIGSGQVFTLWKNGLPSSLADFGLRDTSFLLAGGAGDTMKLVFQNSKPADIYNMMFPVSISVGRLAGKHRYSAAVSFSMLTKNSRSSVDIGGNADSTGRRLDISQSMGLYAITLDLTYGRVIPDRFFSIDKSDRTDFIAGISVSPFISLRRTSSVGAPEDSASDPRLWALRDSAAGGLTSVSASGIAFGWRLGVAKMRRLSKKGGLEGRLCWYGTWATSFRTPDGTLTEKEVSAKSAAPDRKVSYFSNRFEISISLIRKL
jgi:hypothetical protein